ncbi:hypothetical protein N3Z16_06350 [Candidatus Megaera polyxenophila]|uniref:hypothetical protein n=1 Tax=Candidatus Megaera polyxenophila TaxID=988779 RepID=UPI00249F55CC|nr:hypothetical protein N3Z16_06350 [Candidatus Megaera polyxenophila]
MSIREKIQCFMENPGRDTHDQTILSNIIMGYIDIDGIVESSAIQSIDALGDT